MEIMKEDKPKGNDVILEVDSFDNDLGDGHSGNYFAPKKRKFRSSVSPVDQPDTFSHTPAPLNFVDVNFVLTQTTFFTATIPIAWAVVAVNVQTIVGSIQPNVGSFLPLNIFPVEAKKIRVVPVGLVVVMGGCWVW